VNHLFRIIGHRGAAGLAPENTVAAFRVADRLGLQDVELDVQLSRNGELVLFHDGSLDEKTQLSGAVGDYTVEELVQADLRDWWLSIEPDRAPEGDMHLLRLDEVFDEFAHRFTYHVELKRPGPGLARAAIECIDRCGMRDQCVITSFDIDALHEVRELDADIRIGYLVSAAWGGLSPVSIEATLLCGFNQVCPDVDTVSAEMVERAHDRGLDVRVHGVNDRGESCTADRLRKAVEAGCDGGTMDRPDVGIELLGAMQIPPDG
jgi:glycerophosphoryl diester phosphodiesterase